MQTKIILLASAILFAPITTSLGILAPSIAAELPTGPEWGDMDLSPFYRWGDSIPKAPGALLREEPLPLQREMTAAVEATRILYTSIDQRWQSGNVPVSGTLFLPVGQPPQGGWPLVSWGHGTLGTADACAPSWTGFRERDAVYLNRWLEEGFAVVATDYQGLGGPGPHPYSHWQSEGASVLDAIRAARAARPGEISSNVIIAGQSQGGGAALGAAMLARDYAGELTILGAISTAPNSTFPDGPVSVGPRVSSVMFLAFATGGLRESNLRIEDLLTPVGDEVLQVTHAGCTRDVGVKMHELGIEAPTDLLAISLDDLMDSYVPLTNMPLQTTGMPLLIATGLADDTIIPVRQYAVASALCAADNTVQWQSYEGLGHDGVLHGSLDDAIAFAKHRLVGDSAQSNCSSIQAPGAPGELDVTMPFNE